MGAFAGLMALVPRWLLLAGLATCLGSATVQTVRVGHYKTKLAALELQVALERAVVAATVLTLQTEAAAKLKKANTDAKSKTVALDTQLAGSAVELERLRVSVAAGNTAATTIEACSARTDALGVVFNDCSRRYSEVARKADRIAIDRDALLAIFPD
jgi:hypothetical protein